MIDVKSILLENVKRNGKLDAFYDPIRGIGGPIERFHFYYPDAGLDVYLPLDMREDEITSHILKFKTMSQAAIVLGLKEYELFEKFIRERFKHDFEFWAYTCIKILHKDLFKLVPLKLRGAQRKMLYELEIMRTADVPIRIVLLKARQWGGSTLVQIYMFWIQNIHRTSWHLAICAQGDDAAKNISAMYDTAARYYPEDIAKITFKAYNKSTKNKKCVERDYIIGVGSVNNPDQFRSFSYGMAHLSEVGIWQDTAKRKATNLVSSLKETVPDQPYTLVVEESTAKGLNYFYESWKKALSGKSRYKAVFVAWWEIDRCREVITIPIEEYLKSFSDYDWYLWKLGATLEGINWYRKHKEDKGYSDVDMNCENPSTPEEAFQSSGQKVYPPSYVLAVRKHCTNPILTGDIFAKTRIGEHALTDIRIEKINTGYLRVWLLPDNVKDRPIKNRFCAFVDIGGTTSKADYSVIKMIDREPMIYGNDPEVILIWRGHIDQDLLAWKAAQICTAYSYPEIGEYPLLAFEVQSLKKESTEGSHSLTILNQIKDYYPNLYVRNDEEKVGDEYVPKYGFHTNVKSKGLIIDTHKGAMREVLLAETEEQCNWGYVERCEESCNEFSYFEVKQDGSMGAIQGKKDDLVIATAGAVWLAISKMDAPFEIKDRPEITKVKRRGYSTY